jgi:hypothetical protein
MSRFSEFVEKSTRECTNFCELIQVDLDKNETNSLFKVNEERQLVASLSEQLADSLNRNVGLESELNELRSKRPEPIRGGEFNEQKWAKKRKLTGLNQTIKGKSINLICSKLISLFVVNLL